MEFQGKAKLSGSGQEERERGSHRWCGWREGRQSSIGRTQRPAPGPLSYSWMESPIPHFLPSLSLFSFPELIHPIPLYSEKEIPTYTRHPPYVRKQKTLTSPLGAPGRSFPIPREAFPPSSLHFLPPPRTFEANYFSSWAFSSP